MPERKQDFKRNPADFSGSRRGDFKKGGEEDGPSAEVSLEKGEVFGGREKEHGSSVKEHGNSVKESGSGVKEYGGSGEEYGGSGI
jgi:hypothetical protein